MTTSMINILSENLPLVVVFGLILILLGLGGGYLVGTILTRKETEENYRDVVTENAVKSIFVDNVGLGVIAYDQARAVFSNDTIFRMPGFFSTEDFPNTIEEFLNRFDNGNQLKSNYLLGIENGINVTRANYLFEKKVYEIKIIRKKIKEENKSFFTGDYFEIVIVDDITQIKDDERRQKDLAANVSHELKTPLTVIKATDFLIENIDPNNPPTYEEVCKWGARIKLNVERMEDIVKDFLVLSQTSTVNKMGIFDMRACVEKAINSLSDYTGRDRVNIIFEDNDCYPFAYGNDSLTMRVIINLLTNAIKYINYEGKTEPNEIRVSVNELEDRISVRVGDNGMGIPEKDLSHLFERFYRVDNSGSRAVGGSGIGLAIAKEIADMHDGSIAVASKLGSGSTFTYMVPSANSVFKNVYEDSKTSVISDNQFYKSAAVFLGLQMCEAAQSMGYGDLLPIVDAYEKTPEKEKIQKNKNLVALFKAIGDERFDDLLDELLYFDPDMMGDFEEIDEYKEFEEAEIPEAAPVEEIQNNEPQIYQQETIEEEEIRLAQEKETEKEEARKLLTQQILPRSTQFKQKSEGEIVINNETKEELPIIHPTNERKMYNSMRRSGDADENQPGHVGVSAQETAEEAKPQMQSALKKVLDENDTLQGKK